MTDREKLVIAIKQAKEQSEEYGLDRILVDFQAADMILGLLKEQEAVEPAMDEDTPGHWVVLENCSNAGVYCSECHTKIFDHYPMKKKFSYFCPHCGTRMEGQAVKWE